MGWVIPVIAGVSALAGALKSKQKTTSTGKSSSTTLPTFGPEFSGLRDRLVNNAMQRLGGGGGVPLAHNITNANLQGINSVYGNASTGLAAKLAAMGIRGPAAAGALGHLEAGRFGESVGALNKEPLLARQFGQEDFTSAMGLLGLGRGSSMTGENLGNVTGTSGGGLSGAAGGLGEMLGFLASQGYLNLGKKGGTIASGSGGYGT